MVLGGIPVIIGDSEMVDVDVRKLVFCFLIRMNDVGVGAEADYYEKVRNCFHSFFGCQYRIFAVIGEMVRRSARCFRCGWT